MKPFLLLTTRSEDEPAEAEYAAFRARTGLSEAELRWHRLEREAIPEFRMEEWSGVIVGGSPFNTTTPEADKSETQRRVERDFENLLDQLVPADFPFFGACYGIGTLAKHQGAVIDHTYGEEVAAPVITLTEAGRRDPLTVGMPEHFSAFVAHHDAISVPPPGAVVLASGEACPVQMLRIGQNMYATQFHPELDPETFAHRQGFYAHHGYFPSGELERIQAWTLAQDVHWSWQVLRAFAERYARD